MDKSVNLESRLKNQDVTNDKGQFRLSRAKSLFTLVSLAAVLLNSSDAIAQRNTARCPPEVRIRYEGSSATLTFGRNRLEIAKTADGLVYFDVNDRETQQLDFSGNYSFRDKIAKRLDHEIGRRRPYLAACLNEVYSRLGLRASARQEQQRSAIMVPDIFAAPEGKYTLYNTSSPLSYLLVRNINTGGYYCLSLVQELFDMVYGLGEAKRVGLYSSRFAEDLNFAGSPAKVENYDPLRHNLLPKGAILRLTGGNLFSSAMTSIGISLGEGNMAHLIGSSLYIEPIEENLGDGWSPVQVIIPGSTFVEKPLNVRNFGFPFKKNSTIEQISPEIMQKLRLSGNIATIEEIIFQLNKDKFRIVDNYPSGYERVVTGQLIGNTQLRIPAYW